MALLVFAAQMLQLGLGWKTYILKFEGLANDYIYMSKAHQNCIIGQKFCLHHITGTAFIIRLKLYVYIVENSETFQKIYSFMQFK